MKAELKMDACIICGRKVQPTENWIRCHLWGGFASFHWECFGEYLRADTLMVDPPLGTNSMSRLPLLMQGEPRLSERGASLQEHS